MEAARNELERAVAALFTKDRTGSSGDTTFAPDARSAGCGCLLENSPGAWRALQEFPVLARWTVGVWERLADAQAPIPLKKSKSHRAAKACELLARTISVLCGYLHQSGILAASRASDDGEVVALLIHGMTKSSADVLPRVLQSRSLALSVRLRLFQFVISHHHTSTAVAGSNSAAEVKEICLALHEELRDVSVHSVAHATVGKSKKRSRDAMSKGAMVCGGVRAVPCTPWCSSIVTAHHHRAALVVELTKWITNFEATSKKRDPSTTIEAVRGFISVLNAPDITRPIDTKQHSTFASAPFSGLSTLWLRWEDVDRIVDSVSETTSATAHLLDTEATRSTVSPSPLMWKRVFTRHTRIIRRLRLSGGSSKVTLQDVVAACATVDQFVSMPSSKQKQEDLETIGARVVVAVVEQTVGDHHLTLVLRAVHSVVDHSPTALMPGKLCINRSILVQYICRLLMVTDDGEDLAAREPPSSGHQNEIIKKEPTIAVVTKDIVECIHLVHEIVQDKSTSSDDQRSGLFDLWFQLVVRLTHGPTTTLGTSVGTPWWPSFLEVIAQCCAELKLTKSVRVVSDWEQFVSELVMDVVVSNGTRVGSKYQSYIPIKEDAASQSTLETALALIFAAATSVVIAKIIYQLCVIATRQKQTPQPNIHTNAPLWSTSDDGACRLFLPSMHACVTASGNNTIPSVMGIVYDMIKWKGNSSTLIQALVSLLYEWDCYCDRNTAQPRISQANATNTTHTQPKRFLALDAIVQHGLWEGLVRFYAGQIDSMVRQPRTFLIYVKAILQSVDAASCAPQLEGSLFRVLSNITTILSSPTDGSGDSWSKSNDLYLSHSDTTIQRFLAAFDAHDGGRHRYGALVKTLRCEGKLDDLVLCLRRWLRLIVAAPSAIPQETRAPLVVLANRLIYFGGAEFSSLGTHVTAVDPPLLAALQVYSGAATVVVQPAAISVVRLNLMVRSYLALSNIPDLLTLTSAFLEAALNCTTESARDGMLKLLQGFSTYLIMEVVTVKLCYALLLPLGGQEANGLVLKKNALAVLTAALTAGPVRLLPRPLSLSCDVFPLAACQQWLAPLLLMGVASDSGDPVSTELVVALLEFLSSVVLASEGNSLMQMGKDRLSTVFSHSHALAATLSTVALGLSMVEEAKPVVERVRFLSEQIHSVLCTVSEPTLAIDSHAESPQHVLCIAQSAISHGKAARGRIGRRGRPSQPKIVTVTSGLAQLRSGGAVRVASDGSQSSSPRMLQVDQLQSESLAAVAVESTQRTQGGRFFLPFTSWLQWALPPPPPPRPVSQAMQVIFEDVILQFYLPVQFHGEVSAMVAEWLTIWITQCLASTTGRRVALLPFQRALLLNLMSCLPRATVATSLWSCLVHCARVLLQSQQYRTSPSDPMVASEVMAYIVNVLDLETLCIVDFSVPQRTGDSESVTALVDDLVVLLLTHGETSDVLERLRIVEPVVQVFVRACLSLQGQTRSDQVSAAVEQAIIKLAGAVRACFRAAQDAEDIGTCFVYWQGLLHRWKRLYFLTNRGAASTVLDLLVVNETTDNAHGGGNDNDNK